MKNKNILSKMLLSLCIAGSFSFTDVNASSVANFQNMVQADTLKNDLVSNCKIEDSLSSQKESIVKKISEEINLLQPTNDDLLLRKKGSLVLIAKTSSEKAIRQQKVFNDYKLKLDTLKAEEALTVLDDLRHSLLLTAQMRDIRSTMVSVKANSSGAIEISLKEDNSITDASDKISFALKTYFSEYKENGVDCINSEVYKSALGAKDAFVTTYATIKHGDIQKIYDNTIILDEYFSRQIGNLSFTKDQKMQKLFSTVMQDSETLYKKATNVLQNSVAMYQRSVDTMIASNLRNNSNKASSVSASAVSNQLNKENIETLALKEAVDMASITTISPSQMETDFDLIENLTAISPSALPQGLLSFENKKLKIVQDVMRQAADLRLQIAKTDSTPAHELSVATNLLVRIKKIYQFADMMVSDDTTENNKISLNQGDIKVSYIKQKGDLKNITISVNEVQDKDVLMTWSIALNRKDDTNFEISSNFDGIQAGVFVKNSSIDKKPNHSQLIALMNRLNDLIDKKS